MVHEINTGRSHLVAPVLYWVLKYMKNAYRVTPHTVFTQHLQGIVISPENV